MATAEIAPLRPSSPEDWSREARAGRDADLPVWLRGAPAREQSRFDSAVVRGNGVSALVCAARLARSESFADRVVVASARGAESPKLINGCTLRARSLDYFAAALGTTRERVLDVLLGDGAARARTRSQHVSLFSRGGAGEFEPVRMREFMPRRGGASPLAYGTRNSRLVATLAELSDEVGLRWTAAPAASLAACRALAPGDAPIVINGSHLPLEGAPTSAPPRCFVIAWQCTMRRTPGARLPDESSLIAGVARKGGIDIGVFYPFADPLTPDADAYGLFYRVVHPGPDFSKEEAIAEMRETALGVGRAIGWEPVCEEQTAAGAQVPGFDWSDVEAPLEDYFDLHRTFGAGVPIITGCGMARAGLAGWVASEALLHGDAPAPLVNRSLRRWRSMNRTFCAGMEDGTGLAAAALARFPALIFKMGADKPDTWAGATTSGATS
jgi:hypothetical protein